MIRLQTAVDEGLLHFVGEPKSPHGVDVTPDGRELVVSGKLDTHATVYEFEKIRSLIEALPSDPPGFADKLFSIETGIAKLLTM